MTAPGRKGRLVVVEGVDGSGKSTLAAALHRRLTGAGVPSVLTFEPTTGPFGRRLRESFTSPGRLPPGEELALFLADRREHVAQVIAPALAAGKVVVCDRYYFSTMAYQGARGLDPDEIRRTNEAFAPVPDLVLLLVLPVAEALRRIREKRGEAPNNFEAQADLERVAAAFDRLEAPFLHRLDARQPAEVLLEAAWARVRPLVPAAGPVKAPGAPAVGLPRP
ncbi:dTMP kinase [Dissulfurirhabdus thermomarina]|uniref:Thymidylate kinase n=1 Tax=Dissulfurirhabdus thermomarina TaxID=1765737 RepID=A0A6N9TU47_DISTH|nr:dTMP kinase [Dissulfurirhabdus thermomarina]NDY43613.1 dTMP kinase [Dissulfurirhabdus thermomarina]NMX22661.1 dTMP kinase [Dissulfurirhabdus thermomarina]